MIHTLTGEHSESLLVHFRRAELLREEAVGLTAIDLNSRQLCDLELLLNRGFYPLNGYLGPDDYKRVLDEMRLTDGTVWPMPICLDVSAAVAAGLQTGQRIALNDQEGFLLAILSVSAVWQPDKSLEAELIYGTNIPDLHPGVHILFNKTGEWYVGGQVEGLCLPIHYDFRNLRATPAETHRRFTQYGWRRVLGFHTREYLHCAHREMVLAVAREINANIFIQPVAGLDHPGNRDHYTHVHCYQEFARQFPANMTFLGIMPLADRFAGPREALWHAIIRKNYGCSHFMVACDHGDPFAQSAGPLFYPPRVAQQLVADMAAETGIEMV